MSLLLTRLGWCRPRSGPYDRAAPYPSRPRRITLNVNSHAIPEKDEEAVEVFSDFLRGPVVEEITG
jgi:hypothetical protein